MIFCKYLTKYNRNRNCGELQEEEADATRTTSRILFPVEYIGNYRTRKGQKQSHFSRR